MIRSGKLDRTITLQRKAETISPAGTVSDAWADFATVRAELLRAAYADQATKPGEGQGAAIAFRLRYVAGVSTADRLLYDGQPYGIKTVHEFGRRRFLEIECEALR